MRRALLLACLVLPVTLPLSAEELPVRSVTLSNAGLIQIERAGRLAPDAAITFRAPAEDVDDLLKSLMLRDPGGTVEGLRLPAQDLETEAFRGLPLRPADFESRAAVLRALRGQMVEASGTTGRLADAEEAEGGLRVSLLTARGSASCCCGRARRCGWPTPPLPPASPVPPRRWPPAAPPMSD
ncbi:hypothetical protein ACFQU2_17690 [Siccirubricoccus deserti]